MSTERLRRIKEKKLTNTITIYTADALAIGNLLDNNEKGISQISIDTGIEFQNRLQESLATGKEPQRFLQVTIKKAKDQSSNKLEKGQFWGSKMAWNYYRKKERIEKRGEKIKEPTLFEYFFPAETNLGKKIKEDQSTVNNSYSLDCLKDKKSQLEKMFKENTLKAFIKLEIISIVKSN
jgi:hypothetical protein